MAHPINVWLLKLGKSLNVTINRTTQASQEDKNHMKHYEWNGDKTANTESHNKTCTLLFKN